ncbi:MAG: exodeoxyribonuclease large subunit, partial [Actinoplanes sp.]|nr:exodeoxyribonuclease large subunit [Actinoplanes sp.]
ARPELLVDQREAEVSQLRDRALRSVDQRLRRADDDLRHTVARLRALSPAATLQRGYAIVQRADGHVVRAADEVKIDDQLRVRLAEGELRAIVGEHE